MDWHALFVPGVPLLETFIRGSAVYLGLFVLLRVRPRQAGGLGVTDLLLLILIGDAAQNAMSGDYRSITDGLLLVATIAGWDWFLDWLGFRSQLVSRLTERQAVELIVDGRVLRHNLARELITEDELLSQLRQHGVERIEEVRHCFLESDGKVSVIPMER